MTSLFVCLFVLSLSFSLSSLPLSSCVTCWHTIACCSACVCVHVLDDCTHHGTFACWWNLHVWIIVHAGSTCAWLVIAYCLHVRTWTWICMACDVHSSYFCMWWLHVSGMSIVLVGVEEVQQEDLGRLMPPTWPLRPMNMVVMGWVRYIRYNIVKM